MSYIFWETVETTYCTSIIGLLRYNLRTLVVYSRGQRNICFLWFFKESLMTDRRLSKNLFVALSLAGFRVALNYVAWHSLRLHLPSRAKISSHEVPGLPKFHFTELGVALLLSIGMRRGGQGAKAQLARQCSRKFHTESGENLLCRFLRLCRSSLNPYVRFPFLVYVSVLFSIVVYVPMII